MQTDAQRRAMYAKQYFVQRFRDNQNLKVTIPAQSKYSEIFDTQYHVVPKNDSLVLMQIKSHSMNTEQLEDEITHTHASDRKKNGVQVILPLRRLGEENKITKDIHGVWHMKEPSFSEGEHYGHGITDFG